MNICTPNGVFNDTPPDFQTVDEARAFAQKQSDQFAAYLRSTYLNPISPYEASSWPLKLAEAKSYPDCPSLAIEAQARGVDLQTLANKVLEKAAQLAYLEAVIAGKNGAHNDAIKNLATIEDCIAYDWRFEV